jgi:hypothetical protein
VVLQSAGSATSISSDGGLRSSTEYSRAQLESSAAQKDNFFARRMQVCSQVANLVPSPGHHQHECFPVCCLQWLALWVFSRDLSDGSVQATYYMGAHHRWYVNRRMLQSPRAFRPARAESMWALDQRRHPRGEATLGGASMMSATLSRRASASSRLWQVDIILGSWYLPQFSLVLWNVAF